MESAVTRHTHEQTGNNTGMSHHTAEKGRLPDYREPPLGFFEGDPGPAVPVAAQPGSDGMQGKFTSGYTRYGCRTTFTICQMHDLLDQRWYNKDVFPMLKHSRIFVERCMDIEPRHEKTCLCHCNQQRCRSACASFVVCCLDSMVSVVSISEISSLHIASVAVQVGLSYPGCKPQKTGDKA